MSAYNICIVLWGLGIVVCVAAIIQWRKSAWLHWRQDADILPLLKWTIVLCIGAAWMNVWIMIATSIK